MGSGNCNKVLVREVRLFRNCFAQNLGWISLRTFCMNPLLPHLLIVGVSGEVMEVYDIPDWPPNELAASRS